MVVKNIPMLRSLKAFIIGFATKILNMYFLKLPKIE